jgi:hypothetical protein
VSTQRIGFVGLGTLMLHLAVSLGTTNWPVSEADYGAGR